MAEPTATATPTDLTTPEDKHAVREHHNADLQHEDQRASTPETTNYSPSLTDAEPDPEKGHVQQPEKHSRAVAAEPTDPNIIDWDGPDDPETPTNLSNGRKYAIVAIISSITFLTYVLICPPIKPLANAI